MSETLAAAPPAAPPALRCPQCAAPLRPEEDEPFLSCAFCGVRIFLDASRAVKHFLLEPVLDAGASLSAISRWLRSREVVGRVEPAGCDLVFFPLWQVTKGERSRVVPAAGAVYEGLERFEIPAGDLTLFSPEKARGLRGEAARVVEASVPLASALTRAAGRAAGEVSDADARLVHVPLHLVRYAVQGASYGAAVDAAGGHVYPVTAPRSSESRIDLAFTGLMIAGVAADVAALFFLSEAPAFAAALLAAVGWALYAGGKRLARWAES